MQGSMNGAFMQMHECTSSRQMPHSASQQQNLFCSKVNYETAFSLTGLHACGDSAPQDCDAPSSGTMQQSYIVKFLKILFRELKSFQLVKTLNVEMWLLLLFFFESVLSTANGTLITSVAHKSYMLTTAELETVFDYKVDEVSITPLFFSDDIDSELENSVAPLPKTFCEALDLHTQNNLLLEIQSHVESPSFPHFSAFSDRARRRRLQMFAGTFLSDDDIREAGIRTDQLSYDDAEPQVLSDYTNIDAASASRTWDVVKAAVLAGSSPPRTENSLRDALGSFWMTRRLQSSIECRSDTDCLSEYGKCDAGQCRGLDPDLSDLKLIRCVDGYTCRVQAGDLPGLRIGPDFEIIAIPVTELCGAADPLMPPRSIFSNSNRWFCEGDQENESNRLRKDANSCIFNAGISQRTDKSVYVQQVRLCGCPASDGDGSGVPCDSRREFFVPLARVSSQECTRNAHCAASRNLAYCVQDHCAGMSGVAASTGLKVFQCMLSENCSVRTLATDTMGQALKIIPVAASFDCGATGGSLDLDPNLLDDSALPCIVDVNNDGVCEVNLGVAKALGATKLCACQANPDGSGCSYLAEFGRELGLVEVGECVVDIDCKREGFVCVNRSCVGDDLPPYVVSMIPANNSQAVPPVNEITLTWNENIRFVKNSNRKLVIALVDSDKDRSNLKWEIVVRDPSTFRAAEAGYQLSIVNRQLKITPDLLMSSFPQGRYVVGFEGGIVSDMQGNLNVGTVDLSFSVATDGGCPYLHVTGFSTLEANPNGLYIPVPDPINGHAAYKGGASELLHLYWRAPSAQQPGNWIFSATTDERHFVAYADLSILTQLGKEGEARPPSGPWKKWNGKRWELHPDVIIHCGTSLDRTFPKLIDIQPRIGATGIPTEDSTFVMRFSEPVTYGHWASMRFESRDVSHKITLEPDFESGMRREFIKSDMAGTVEIVLPERLLRGTTYDIVVELGFLTDLAYNPWGPVEPGVLYFTTFGRSCGPFAKDGVRGYLVDYDQLESSDDDTGDIPTHNDDLLGRGDRFSNRRGSRGRTENRATTWEEDDDDGKTIAGMVYPDETKGAMRCSSGYSAFDATGKPFGDSIASFECKDGEWVVHPDKFRCLANCGPYYELGPQYNFLEAEPAAPDGTRPHGASLTVKCAKDAVIMKGSGEAKTVCHDGKWTSFTEALICGASCGPFPSLGASYQVQYLGNDPASGATTVGSRRLVQCAPGAVARTGFDKQTVVCEEPGWSPITLDCFIPCEKIPLPPEFAVLGTTSSPGTNSNALSKTANSILVGCAPGYSASSNVETTVMQCTDGRWEQEQQLQCLKNCGKFDRGEGYLIEPVAGAEREVSDADVSIGRHGVKIQVSCLPTATQSSGNAAEILTCSDGEWDLGELVCNSPCLEPTISLGRSYSADISPVVGTMLLPGPPPRRAFSHGTLSLLYCSAQSEVVEGIPPEQIICNNGAWTSAASDLMATDQRSEKQIRRPHLRCQRPCGPLQTDGGRYIDIDIDNDSAVSAPLIQSASRRQVRRVACAPGYAFWPARAAQFVQMFCDDGLWKPAEDVDCLPVCSQTQIAETLARNNYVPSAVIVSSMKHNELLPVQCRRGTVPILKSGPGALRCVAGKITAASQSSILVCAEPRCDDGQKNGDEDGVDCGGSCRNRCSSCALGSETCTPSCSDNIQNGDEEGIDCGGSECKPCSTCRGVPAQLEGNQDFLLTSGSAAVAAPLPAQLATKRSFREGDSLHVVCASRSSFSPESKNLYKASFRSFTCGADGDWILMTGLNREPCLAQPSCSDGIQNGDEWGVDCGGSCSERCPTCSDGEQNRDEAGVDCGGQFCIPCSSCPVAPFKALDLNAARLEKLTKDVIEQVQRGQRTWRTVAGTQIAQPWNADGTQHGEMRRIACRNSKVSADADETDLDYSILLCDDGIWTALAGASSIPQVRCLDGASVINTDGYSKNGPSSAGALSSLHFQQLAVPQFSDCRKQTSRNDRYSLCCRLVEEVNQFFSSECGALVFGGRHSQVDSFCTGRCAAQLKTILTGEFVHCSQTVALLRELLDTTFCGTGTGVPDSASLSSSAIVRCFSTAANTLVHLRDLHLVTDVVLKSACEPDSCFSRNLRYFEVITELQKIAEGPDAEQPSRSPRLLRQIDTGDRSQYAYDIAHVSNFFTTVTDAFILQEQQPKFRLLQTSDDSLSSTGHSLSGTALMKPTFLSFTASSSAVRELIATNRHTRKMLQYLCLRDSEGRSCRRTVASLVVPKSSSSPGAVANSAVALQNPCEERCLLEITRHVGQALYTAGMARLEPYSAILGLLMRGYGRVACQRPATGGTIVATCGELFSVGSHSQVAMPRQARLPGAHDYPDCRCPVEFIGDGHCDAECYSPACGYDENDCTFGTMFSATAQRLESLLSLSDSCHPLHQRFTCGKQGSFDSTNGRHATCRDAVARVVKAEGCCAATRFELLREIASAEAALFQGAAARAGKIERLSRPLVLNRSTVYFEVACGMSLDRTCTRGLKRHAIQFSITITQIKHNALLSFAQLEEMFTDTLREAISSALAVPTADIIELRTWPAAEGAGTECEIVVDTGASLSDVVKDLQSIIMQNAIAAAIESAIKEVFLTKALASGLSLHDIIESRSGRSALKRALQASSNISENIAAIEGLGVVLTYKLVPTKSESLSIDPAGPLPKPIIGTLGLSGLEIQPNALSRPSCGASLGLSPPGGFSADFASSSAAYIVETPLDSATANSANLEHGAKRLISCGPGYAPSLDGGQAHPQLLVCDRGRWVVQQMRDPRERALISGNLLLPDLSSQETSFDQVKLVCRKPCDAPFNENSLDDDPGVIVLHRRGEAQDGAAVTLGCQAGYSPVPAESRLLTETLQCSNGEWQKQTLRCARIERATVGAALAGATCGSITLADVIPQPQHTYSLKLILPQSEAIDVNASLEPESGRIAQTIALWSLSCIRGYIAETSDPSPIVCLNGQFYTTKHMGVSDWELSVPKSEVSLESGRAEQMHAQRKRHEILQQARAGRLEPLAIAIRSLECKEDVRSLPDVAPNAPGLSDPVLYTLIFGGMLATIAAVVLAYFCRRTACMSQPFFQQDSMDDPDIIPTRFQMRGAEGKFANVDNQVEQDENLPPKPPTHLKAQWEKNIYRAKAPELSLYANNEDDLESKDPTMERQAIPESRVPQFDARQRWDVGKHSAIYRLAHRRRSSADSYVSDPDEERAPPSFAAFSTQETMRSRRQLQNTSAAQWEFDSDGASDNFIRFSKKANPEGSFYSEVPVTLCHDLSEDEAELAVVRERHSQQSARDSRMHHSNRPSSRSRRPRPAPNVHCGPSPVRPQLE